MIPVSCWCFILLLLVSRAIATEVPKQNHQPTKLSDDLNDEKFHQHDVPPSSDVPRSRTKRLIWVTDDGRLALPPGTSLVIAPTLAMPFVRYPPDGFHSNISISIPLTIDFDKLGLTDNQNPLGTLGPLFARGMSRSAGNILADYVFKYLKHRTKRDIGNDFIKVNRVDDEVPKLPDSHKHAFHGGERAILYAVLEDFVSQFGMDGKACILRTICEVHSKNVNRYGLIGEVMKLFFTASLSPFSELLADYVKAEQVGKEVTECYPYVKRCPKSIFAQSMSSFAVPKNTQESMSFAQKNSVTINSESMSM